jgi:hypothetical protein
MTPAELTEIDADRARARWVFVCWLVLATALTLAGNAAAAVLPSLPPTGVRLAVHLLPPLIALVGLHALTALARAGAIHRARKGVTAALRDAGPVYGGAVAGVLGIAALAVTLSYAGLIEVARAGGLSHGLAAVWPLTIDLGIAVSTMALLVLRPISAADQRAARRATSAAASASRRTASTASSSEPAASSAASTTALPLHDAATDASPNAASARHDAASTDAAPAASSPVSRAQHGASAAATSDAAPEITPQHLSEAARMLHDRVVNLPTESVALVLAWLERGASARRIHAETDIDPRTVGKIRDATESAQPRLAAVH